MAGWLACMVVMAVAGREATRELSVFQVMELRSLIGFCLLYPLIRRAGGLRAMKTAHPWRRSCATSRTTARSAAGWRRSA